MTLWLLSMPSGTPWLMKTCCSYPLCKTACYAKLKGLLSHERQVQFATSKRCDGTTLFGVFLVTNGTLKSHETQDKMMRVLEQVQYRVLSMYRVIVPCLLTWSTGRSDGSYIQLWNSLSLSVLSGNLANTVLPGHGLGMQWVGRLAQCPLLGVLVINSWPEVWQNMARHNVISSGNITYLLSILILIDEQYYYIVISSGIIPIFCRCLY